MLLHLLDQFDSFVISLNSFIVLDLIIEGNAFTVPAFAQFGLISIALS